MATKTLILRPNSTIGVVNASNIVLTPSTTAEENIHLLINEEVPDDAATQINLQNTLSTISFGIPLDWLSNIIPVSMRIVLRFSIDKPNLLDIEVFFTDPNIPNTGDFSSIVSRNDFHTTLTDSYETQIQTVENLEAIKTALLNGGYISIMAVADSVNNKGGNARVTQLYLEVDYDDEIDSETPLLYLKEGDTWAHITGTIYEKVNGVWSIGTLNKLSSGDNIIIKEV